MPRRKTREASREASRRDRGRKASGGWRRAPNLVIAYGGMEDAKDRAACKERKEGGEAWMAWVAWMEKALMASLG